MTTPHQPHRTERRDVGEGMDSRAAALGDAALRWRVAEREAANVVPFDRARRDGRTMGRHAPDIVVDAAARPPAASAEDPPGRRWTALLACSLAIHIGLYLPFRRDPAPLASIGLEMVSVELVLGADEDAGLIRDGGTAAVSAPEPARAPDAPNDPAPNEQPADIASPSAPQPAAAQAELERALSEPERPSTDQQTEPSGHEPAAAPPQAALLDGLAPAPAAAKPAAPNAVAEERAAETALPQKPHPKLKEPPPPASVRARPPEARTEREADRRRPRPQHAVAAPAKLQGAPHVSTTSAPAAAAAGGIGRGRSDAEANYRGRVAAHLARYRQFPPEARNRGDHGRAVVSFSLDGSGAVTEARLVRGTGVAALDREAVAMVRRASPFPPPPDGRGMSFTAPVSFELR